MRFRILKEALELHQELNPKLFDSNNKLHPEVLKAFQDIIVEFIDEIQEDEIPIEALDTWLVGSNASYNYSFNSDIDLHIQVDLEDTSAEPKLLSILYNYIKSTFNKKYDITIKGMPVELYIEDINSTAITNGIYSLNKNDWIKFPKKIEVPKIDLEHDSNLFGDYLRRYLYLPDEEVQDFINELYLLRKTSLSIDGEFGEGNLIFKEFRNRGYLDNLKDKVTQMKSKELTLEHLNKRF